MSATLLIISGMYFKSPYYESSKIKDAETVIVDTSSITDYINLKGNVIELDRRELFPKYLSRILTVHVSQGQYVHHGDILMTLETADENISAQVFYSEIRSRLEIGAEPPGSDDLRVSSALDVPAGIEYYIISPIEGTVMDIYCGEGDHVSGILPCIVVSDMTKLGVRAKITEANAAKISAGMECSITVPALDDKRCKGYISAVSPYASAASLLDQDKDVTCDVTADITSKDAGIIPGYSAELKIVTGTDSGRIVLPYDCVSQDSTGEYVFIADSSTGILSKEYITTGRELAEGFEVTSGANTGDIVIRYPEKYSAGERVKIG